MPALNACQRISVPSRDSVQSSTFPCPHPPFLSFLGSLSPWLSLRLLPSCQEFAYLRFSCRCVSIACETRNTYIFSALVCPISCLVCVCLCVCVCLFLLCSVKFNARFCRIFALTTIRVYNRLCIENESSNLMAPHCNQK